MGSFGNDSLQERCSKIAGGGNTPRCVYCVWPFWLWRTGLWLSERGKSIWFRQKKYMFMAERWVWSPLEVAEVKMLDLDTKAARTTELFGCIGYYFLFLSLSLVMFPKFRVALIPHLPHWDLHCIFMPMLTELLPCDWPRSFIFFMIFFNQQLFQLQWLQGARTHLLPAY